MKFLILGDIVGRKTVEYLQKNLWSLRKAWKIDAVIANGENATDIMGLSAEDAKTLLDCGVDVLTGGNHTFHNRSLYPMLEDDPRVLRPLNVPAAAPGTGETVVDVNGYRVLVLNLIGMMNMEHSGSMFEVADRALDRHAGGFDYCIVDLHAEATAEKQALGYYLDGRVTAVCGTHTHVQTADAHILPKGTAYITDLGMCGPVDGILGTDREVILRRMTTGTPQKFKVAEGKIALHGVLVTADGKRATAVEPFQIQDENHLSDRLHIGI